MYYLESFQLLTFREDKYVLYGYGAAVGHLMDWRGGNIWHGRLPNSPVFSSEEEALNWLWNNHRRIKTGMEMSGLPGHHAGIDSCPKGCDDRIVINEICFPKQDQRKEEWIKETMLRQERYRR